MVGEVVVLVAFLLLLVAAPAALLVLVESERDAGTEMDRASAERSARRDTYDPSARNRGS